MDDFMGIVLLLSLIVIQVLVGALIGKHKGRVMSGVVWSALLGVFGWLIVLLMKDLRRKCPHCCSVINKGAIRCCHCGQALYKWKGLPLEV